MNAVPQIATRSTSIDQLPDSSAPPAAVAPVVLSAPPLASGMVGAVPGADAGQSSGVAGPSDSELVNDILQEINQSNAAKQAGGVVDANSVTQQQHTNDSAFARQMDPNMNRDIPAVTPQQADNYAAAGKASATTPGTTSTTTSFATASHDPDLARTLAAAQSADAAPSLLGGFGGFDVIQYAKTLLLFMIVYIVMSNTNIQQLLCKLPYFCANVAEVTSGSAPQMSFLGTVVVAVFGGVAMASVQAYV